VSNRRCQFDYSAAVRIEVQDGYAMVTDGPFAELLVGEADELHETVGALARRPWRLPEDRGVSAFAARHPGRVAQLPPPGAVRQRADRARRSVRRPLHAWHRGEPVDTVQTGGALTFRIYARAEQRIEPPVFRLEIHNTHGMVIGGANTRYQGMNLDIPEGSFTIDYQIDHLLLVPGAYDISATLLDWDLKDPYDVRHRFQRFFVEFGSPPDIDGFTSLGGRWSELSVAAKSAP
jgi:hypothetical protein